MVKLKPKGFVNGEYINYSRYAKKKCNEIEKVFDVKIKDKIII